jgi:hypothetical protein
MEISNGIPGGLRLSLDGAICEATFFSARRETPGIARPIAKFRNAAMEKIDHKAPGHNLIRASLATSLVAILLATTTLQAAESCKQFSFIYRTSFEQGDGEGMETHQCKESNFSKGDTLFKKMQGMLNADQPQQARQELERALAVNENVDFNKFKVNEELCVRPAQKKPFETLMQQLGKKFSANAENRGKLNDAININMRYCLYDDAARVHLIAAEKDSGDASALKFAQSFSKQYSSKSFNDKLQSIASKQSQAYIDRENKFFKTSSYSPMFLGQAVGIMDAVEDTAGKSKITKLAESRGDELATQNSCRILTIAREYYQIAHQDNKIKTLKTKAMKIGTDLEKQNNTQAASVCYELAGDDSRADKMQQATEAKAEKAEAALQKNEPARKAKFSKEQDDMEKELGL